MMQALVRECAQAVAEGISSATAGAFPIRVHGRGPVMMVGSDDPRSLELEYGTLNAPPAFWGLKALENAEQTLRERWADVA
jgi:hypothetical protein